MALIGVGFALFYALDSRLAVERSEIFTGMLVYDAFATYIRVILLTFVLIFIVFTRLTRVPDPVDSVDFYCLIIGSTLGMCLMAAANHLLMVFLAIEMASVPSYALAGILKSNKKGSEAALKYSIFGAASAGIMLYGISLIAGVLNTVHIPTAAVQLAENLPAMIAQGGSEPVVLVLGGLMLMAGLAFKLSAVPFHFWCPDVFEGATAEVAAFLSIASKAAALALLVRVSIGFGVLPQQTETEKTETAAVVNDDGYYSVAKLASDPEVSSPADLSEDSAADPLAPVRSYAGLLIGALAAITCTFGNLAAYGQTNIKRLLGYSTIAHAGYMMMAVPAALALVSSNPGDPGNAAAKLAIGAMSVYIAVYAIMNLGAFAFVAFLRNSIHSEEIADYAGLIKRAPVSVIVFSLILFSLVGLPPLAGFLGKFLVFGALADAYRDTGNIHLIVLLVIGGINTAISLFYYLRVVKVMTIDAEDDSVAARPIGLIPIIGGAFIFALGVPIVTLLIYFDHLNKFAQWGAGQLF